MEHPATLRIGELLVRANVVTANDVAEAEQLSRRMGTQFGRTLIMSGSLSERMLEEALMAQKYIAEGIVSLDVGCECLGLAKSEGITFAQAMSRMEVLPRYSKIPQQLAQVLREAKILSREEAHVALQLCMETNEPIIDILVREEVIKPTFAPNIVRAQQQLKEGQVSLGNIVQDLAASFSMWQKAEESVKAELLARQTINAVPIVSAPVQVTMPVSVSGQHQAYPQQASPSGQHQAYPQQAAPSGQYAAYPANAQSGQHISYAPNMQSGQHGAYAPPAPPAPVKTGQHGAYPPGPPPMPPMPPMPNLVPSVATPPPPSAPPPPSIDLNDASAAGLLLKSGYFSRESLLSALSEALTDAGKGEQILKLLELVDDQVLQAAQRCQFLLEKKRLKKEQAITALSFYRQFGGEFPLAGMRVPEDDELEKKKAQEAAERRHAEAEAERRAAQQRAIAEQLAAEAEEERRIELAAKEKRRQEEAEAEQGRQRIAAEAEQEQQRIAAEAEQERLRKEEAEAEQERQRVEAEADENRRQEEAEAEQERQRIAAEAQQEQLRQDEAAEQERHETDEQPASAEEPPVERLGEATMREEIEAIVVEIEESTKKKGKLSRKGKRAGKKGK